MNTCGRNKNVSSGVAVEIEARRVLRVDACSDAVGQRIEARKKRWDLLVAKLDSAREITGLNCGSDVLALRVHIFIAARHGLCLQIEVLIPDHEKCAVACGDRQAVLVRVDRLDINDLRKLYRTRDSRRAR